MEKFTPLATNFTLPPALTAWTNFTSDANFNTLADVLVQKTPGCQLLKGEADPKVL